MSTRSITRSRLPLALLAVIVGTGYTMMHSFGIMAESAKRELGFSDATLAFIQGGGAIPLFLFSIPVGILVDRTNRVRILIAMCLIWTLGTLLTALVASVSLLFIARTLIGIGTAGALTAALSLAADLCLPQERGKAATITNVGKTVGTAAGFAVGGLLIGVFAWAPDRFGLAHLPPWRSAQLTLAAISLTLILPLLFLREPDRHEFEAPERQDLSSILGELWRRRAFLAPLFAGQAGIIMGLAATSIWSAPVIERNYGLPPPAFAHWLGAILLVAGIGGSIVGGHAADWGQNTGRRGGLLLGTTIASVVVVPAALFPLMPNAFGFAALLAIFMFSGTITGLAASVAITVLLPNEYRGICIGAFMAFSGLIGFGLTPFLVAWVSLILGGEGHLGSALGIVVASVGLLSAMGFLIAYLNAPASPAQAEVQE